MFKKKFPSLSSLGSDGNTAFLRAARAGHLDKVLEHLKANIDINTSNSNGLNALHLASKDGHVNVVTELLKRGAAVDAATKKGNTALHIASLAGQEEVVRLLVESGAAVNVQSQNGFTPLYMAAQENHDNVVRFLLASGANQSLATEDGFTPLAVAMQQGHDKVVAVLLENDTRGKVRLPALHIAAKKDDCKAAALLLQNEHNPDVTSKSGFTPLHIAAHYGNEGIATLLLSKGADVNYSAKHSITPLHVAAKWGKANMVALLLERGANIDAKTRDGLTPLHCAARSGHEQVVDMMLERGAPISSKTKNGLAPLHMASQGDHVDAARILLYHRAPVDEVTVDYLTALHVAAHCGHVRVAKLLLDRKADPNARALNGFTPLHIACKKNRIKVVELLLKHGASIEATTESGLTPLHVASFMGCMNIVIYLLQHDASPDVPTVRGETPLHLAARANQTDIIRILLRNGAQVDARAREQQTPLHIASRLGNVDIVMLLLQHGAAVDSTTKDMYTALHIAAKEGQEEVASVLLEHGASLTATTKKGLTPLHLAAKYGNMKVAKLLLQRDAPVDAQGKNGVTPLHVASHYDHQNVALLLLDKGASPHATAKNGHTPLHIAARKNQMDIATTLLEYGAKANAESKAGFTPLHLSSQEGHTDMSSLLIEHKANTSQKAKNGLTPLHLCAQEDRVNVAAILMKNGAEVDPTTKAGYTPLHVASHFGQLNMVRFLLSHGATVASTTSIGYTPLHQAAQQGHASVVSALLDAQAPPNALTTQGQTPLSIAQKLGYISVVETLKGVTEPSMAPAVGPADEKYRVVAPESMQETFMSDSEDEGGEDTTLSDQPYRYLTVDEMKSLGDDSLPIDVTRDERSDSNRDYMAPPTAMEDSISPLHLKESHAQFAANYQPDNIDINKHPINVGFLVSFLVDARGGAMRGCRHSGVRVIVPPRRAPMPTRVTCRYLKRDKLSHPPPLMEGEALASRILELGPVGAKFLGPVIIEVPHFGSLRGMEREIVILRSDNGETWREHTFEASDDAIHDVLNESFEGEELTALEESASGRTTRILTSDFPQYFAVVSRIRQEVHAIGPEGGMVSSSVVPQVQAVFPQGALTKKIKVGLQAQPISTELTAKLLGNRVAVSPIVTVEPRRRKFHKPITLTIPVPQAANKGMINQYSGDAPTLRLLCSITGGTTRAQWEDVTGSTPLTFVNDCVSFTTTVSARFWLMDCRNIGEATKMATELYKEAIHVPFMAKFVVFAKRVDVLEARLRVFCMTDDKEDKTLEHQENFTEVAKSRDVEVLEGKSQFVEFAGNLVPVTKSGDQLQLGFRAFRENRLPFTVRVKDPHADTVGRILFMREPKVAKGEPPQQPICVLNIVLPETIVPDSGLSEPDLLALQKKYSFLRDGGLGRTDLFARTNLRLADISNLLGDDWVPLATELDVSPSDRNLIKSEFPSSVAQQAMAMLRLWLQKSGNKATGNVLETALRKIGRDDIVQQCSFNIDDMDRAVAKVHLDQSGFDAFKEELGPSRDASLRRDTSLNITYDEQDIMKESESVEDLNIQEKKVPKIDGKIPLSPIIKTEKYEKEKRDADELEERKYVGEEKEVEEKVVEEERKTVAQLKEIFAADKRDRQYERQPKFEDEKSAFKALAEESSQADEDQQKVSSTKDADHRRDSELLQGVSEGLVRLETTCKVITSTEDVLSPKVSKTPPPSPAEFKDTTDVPVWHRGSQLLPEQSTAAIECMSVKDDSHAPTESAASKSEQEKTSKPKSSILTSPKLDSESPPVPQLKSIVDVKESEQIVVEDIKSYSDRKKFWEQMSASQSKPASEIQKQNSQDTTIPPPIPKPRSSLPVISLHQGENKIKSESENDFEMMGESIVQKHPPSSSVSKQSTFTGSSDTSYQEGSEPEFTDKSVKPAGVPTTAVSAVAVTTKQQENVQVERTGSSDSEVEFLAKFEGQPLAFENTGFVSDEEETEKEGIKEEFDDKDDDLYPEKRTLFEQTFAKGIPVAATRKSVYERSVSLPTSDLAPFDPSGSVRAKKRYFEAQIKKEMVVEQLMTQLEEEGSPEHKSIYQSKEIDKRVAEDGSSISKDDEFNKFTLEENDAGQAVRATITSVKDLAKEFEKVSSKDSQITTSDISKGSFTVYPKEEFDIKSPTVHQIQDKENIFPDKKQAIEEQGKKDKQLFEKVCTLESEPDVTHLTETESYMESVTEMKEEEIKLQEDDTGSDLQDEEDFTYQHAESISRTSDSLEVHVDKSETEETEKEIDEDIKEMEKQAEQLKTSRDIIPTVTITSSGKQYSDYLSQEESGDTTSEPDITPEEVRGVFQPEEHLQDTIWEVPVQEQIEVTEEAFPADDVPLMEEVGNLDSKSQSEGIQLTKEEARLLAEEVVEKIEEEVSKRSLPRNITQKTISPPVPPPEAAETQVAEYLRQLAEKEKLEPREVQLMESVIAKKHREQIKKLSRTDTTTSSMEITDEDLRSSGVETDLSPLESQAGKFTLNEEGTSSEGVSHESSIFPISEITAMLTSKDVETVEKTLAEVRESLEAAQEELIEEHKKKKDVIHKKESPSEFEFKVLSFEKKSTDKIEESFHEELGTSTDHAEYSEHGKYHHESTNLNVTEDIYKGKSSEKLQQEEFTYTKAGEEFQSKTVLETIKDHESQSMLVEAEMFLQSKESNRKNEEKTSVTMADKQDASFYTDILETKSLSKEKIEDIKLMEQRENLVKSHQDETISSTKQVEDTETTKLEKEELKKEGKTCFEKSERKIIETTETKVLQGGTVVITQQITQQKQEKKTEEELISEKQYKKICKIDPGISEVLTEQVMLTQSENIELNAAQDDIKATHESTIKRASSEESQKSLSQDESMKSPVETISSSSSSVRVVERPDGTEATVVMRHPRPDSAALRADRRSGAELEAWSSSGESHYHSFEQTYSRPCSSDVEALVSTLGGGTAGSSEYETAMTSQELSTHSATSHEYHTAVSSLSSRESMKSLDSESSGHLASIEVSSEASETLVPSAQELERDMDGIASSVIEEDEHDIDYQRDIPFSVKEPYDSEIPAHIIRGEKCEYPFKQYSKLSTSKEYSPLQTRSQSSDEERESPFEVIGDFDPLEYRDDLDPEDDSYVRDNNLPTSTEEDRPQCMKRSYEMIFQPEPHPIITESPSPESPVEHPDEKLGSSVEEGSILSMSSISDTGTLRTVIERYDSEKIDLSATPEQYSLTISGTSEQLSLDDTEISSSIPPLLVDSGTSTFPSTTSDRELHLTSVTITTSSIDDGGIQSVCTQVTSQSHTPVQDEDDEAFASHIDEIEFYHRNGPTQVDYIPEYDDYEDTRKKPSGHRRKESTSSFTPVTASETIYEKRSTTERYVSEELAESDKYAETGPLTLKEVSSDEKKDIDEAEKSEEESYHTEADQGFHRDLREGKLFMEEVSSIDEDPEAEFRESDTSRPQSQVSKSDSESQRPMSSGFSDDRPDSELADLLKQCSLDGGKDIDDPIERPLSPEPIDECELKDDTPEFSSEAQASVTELEMEYSGAFSRCVEYASHVSPIREERMNMQYDEQTEAEAAFSMIPHLIPSVPSVLPATIPEDPAAEKHELETREASLKERHQEAVLTSPSAIPDITVTQHMTPLVDKGFHYPDLELEETTQSTPQTPASMSSRGSSETETDQGREYVLEQEVDYVIPEEQDDQLDDKFTDSKSTDVSADEKTVYGVDIKTERKIDESPPASDSPASDSFEMLEKPDLTDEYVVIEEVGKEADEHDTEGKSIQIERVSRVVSRKQKVSKDEEEEVLIPSPPAPMTKMTNLKYYPETSSEEMGPFPFDSDSPPTAIIVKKGVGAKAAGEARSYGYEGEYDHDVEASKKWIEMQFQGEPTAAGYGYEMEFERGPLEDIKEEETNDFDQSSSKVGSIGSYQASLGSIGSMKESFSSTPEYDVLAGRKYFTRSGEHDDISMSSLQEFEQLERQLALEASRKRSHGSQDSLSGSGGSRKHTSSSKSGQGDDISLSSLKEFEGLETACIEAAIIENKAKEEEALLSEIEEGHESQISESESCETMSATGGKGESVDSDDYEKRMFEIDEIIKQAQSNVEKFIDSKDRMCFDENLIEKTESLGRGDSLEEVARAPELDMDQPFYIETKRTTSWRDAENEALKTSTDSLDIKATDDPMQASTDSLDLKTVAERSGDLMTASSDSIELQLQLSSGKQHDVMTDSIEMAPDSGIMAASTDSLDMGAISGGAMLTDSIEEEETSMLGQTEERGSGSGGQDQSSSSGRDGDFSSSGREDNSGDQAAGYPVRADMMLGSTDSLDPSSSTATHATYQYETDSVMSSSFTSGGSNTMVSSTDTLDPAGATALGLDSLDLAAAVAHPGVWFEDVNNSGSKPFVTEIIEPNDEGEFSHTIKRTVQLPPEIHKVTFTGPDAEVKLQKYVEYFSPGEDTAETEETDSDGNVHIKRVIQQRMVVRSTDLGERELTGPELEKYFSQFHTSERLQSHSGDPNVPDSDYAHLLTSITGKDPLDFHATQDLSTHHTYVTHHVIPGAVVQGKTTPHLTADITSELQAGHSIQAGMREEADGEDTPPPYSPPSEGSVRAAHPTSADITKEERKEEKEDAL